MNAVFSTLWASVVRTFVPLIVGAVLSWAATAGIPLDDGFEPALIAVLSFVFGAVYHIGIRLLEIYVSPRFGWLLGLAKSPDSYTAGNAPAQPGLATDLREHASEAKRVYPVSDAHEPTVSVDPADRGKPGILHAERDGDNI